MPGVGAARPPTGARMWNDFDGRAVLVTGGTRGIGRATGLAFGSRGAHVTLTHRWGSADEESLRREFAACGAPTPDVVEADASNEEDIVALLQRIRARHDRLDVLVSNVAFAPVVHSLGDFTRRGLHTAIDYTTWPLVALTRVTQEVFGRYPRYVVAVSSEGAETLHVGYDAVAAAKAALEALCRYLHHRLRDHDVRVNAVRTRFVDTEALRATFGAGFPAFVEHHAPGLFTTPGEVAAAIFGVCSGLMDGVGGQIITVDHGANISDNFSRLFSDRDRLPPWAPTK